MTLRFYTLFTINIYSRSSKKKKPKQNLKRKNEFMPGHISVKLQKTNDKSQAERKASKTGQ